MKKLLTSVAVAATMMTTAQAGDAWIADITAGVSTPIMGPSLQLGTTKANAFDPVSNFGLGAGIQMNIWAELDHFVPIIPNVRVEQSSLYYSGKATQNYTFAGTTYSASSASILDFSNQDAIMYWGVPFATLIPFVEKIDFGLGVKVINGQVGVEAVGVQKFTAPIPYGWLRAAVEIPVVGIGLEYNQKYIGTGPDGLLGTIANFSEISVMANWGIDLPVPVIKLEAGVEGGYKSTTFDVNVPDKVYINGSFGGVVLGIYAQFGI